MKKINKKTKITIFIVAMIVVLTSFIAIIINIAKRHKTESDNIKGDNVVYSIASSKQAEIDEEIKEDLNKNNYTLEEARIYIDPYKCSPLTALIVFETNKKSSIEVTIKGKNDDDISYTLDEKEKNHFVPIYALYPNHKNEVEITLNTGQNKKFIIEIGDIEVPGGNVQVPKLEIVSSNTKVLDNSLYFITSPLYTNPFAFDKSGQIRWYSTSTYLHDIKFLDNGHILIGTMDMNEYTLATKIYEIDLLGRIYKEYDIPQGYLNDFFLRDNGNIIITSRNENRKTYSDYIIEIDGKTGNIEKTIDIFELFKSIDSEFTDNLSDSYFFNSGIEYYENTDELLLTYWGGEFVIDIDYSESSINWIFSDPTNFTDAFNDYLLKGTDDFSYPRSMHSATLEGNTLRVFNNGYKINNEEVVLHNLKGSYSSANTYKINGKNISLESEINKNKELFSYALADYKHYKNRDLILFGRELVNPDYDSNININDFYELSSYVIEQKDGENVLEVKISCASLTIDKFSIENKKYDFDFANSIVISSLYNKPNSTINEDIKIGLKDAEENDSYIFGFANNILEHDIHFFEDEEFKIIVTDKNYNGEVYKIKEKGKTNYLKKIKIDLNPGKYEIYVLFNGITYKTGKYITVS